MESAKKTIKVGYLAHWIRPEYNISDFINEQGYELTKIDHTQKYYLEDYDVVLIEQNGFNDYIENDEDYIREWIGKGGILCFFHQSFERWAPYFLPPETGYTQLIYRHVNTIGGCAPQAYFTADPAPYKNYLMPWIEKAGLKLFNEPEVISNEEMIDWRVRTIPTYDQVRAKKKEIDTIRSSAESCFLLPDNWEILGSYADPAVRDGALIARVKFGKGYVMVNQILFPDYKPEDENDRCIAFWKKYIKNLWAYFTRIKNGESEEFTVEKKSLPIKDHYKLCTHMHSLDWYGCDSQPGTINAMMKYRNIDIASIAVKDNAAFKGHLDVEKYSDGRALMLHGQEYHPFNWGDKWAHLSHNGYHILAIGMNGEDYTTQFTKSLFGDEECFNETQRAIDYVHASGGVATATHPASDHWADHDFDGIDLEPLKPLSGNNLEKHWLLGKTYPVMVSVDLFGFRRILDNPTSNIIYLKGKAPNRDTVCQAIRNRNTIACSGFDDCDIKIGDILPGDFVSINDLKNGTLSISAKVYKDHPDDMVKMVRVYSADKVIWEQNDINQTEIDIKVPLKDYEFDKYLRVEIEGRNHHHVCLSTPFFIKK